MATKDHGDSTKDDDQDERRRERGASKEKAARIANTPRSTVAERGGTSSPDEEWTVDELQQGAQEIGIDGRSNMNKDESITAVRNH